MNKPNGAKCKGGSGAATVYDTLKREILELRLKLGSLLNKTNLAQKYGMSRTPIWEALIKLSGAGLALTRPNQSAIVAPFDFLDLSQFFDALTLMCRLTTRLAELHRIAAKIELIRYLQHGQANIVAAKHVSDMIEVNRNFHAAIAEAGKNRYYCKLFGRLLDARSPFSAVLLFIITCKRPCAHRRVRRSANQRSFRDCAL